MLHTHIIYINDKSILQVHLLDGSVFEYYGVPKKIYEKTLSSREGEKSMVKKLSKEFRYDSV